MLYSGCTVRVLSNAREVWVGIVQLVFRMTRTHTDAHTRKRRSTVRSCRKMKTSKYGCCCALAAATSKAYGVIQVDSNNMQHNKNEMD